MGKQNPNPDTERDDEPVENDRVDFEGDDQTVLESLEDELEQLKEM